MGKDSKLHILIIGRRNNGKSSIINRVTGQDISIISDIPGTTTDIVKRSYEIPGFASVIFMDSAGIDDPGTLGEKRVERSKRAIGQADIAILVIAGNLFGEHEEELIERFNEKEIPFIIVHNKKDIEPLREELKRELEIKYPQTPIIEFTSTIGSDTSTLIDALKKVNRIDATPQSYIGDLVSAGDTILLVTPIDSEAPIGRLILPQVQLIRDTLDNHCCALAVQPDEIDTILSRLNRLPNLVITDSQVFKKVAEAIPEQVPLTSFSIVLARYKGNFQLYLKGTPYIDQLKDGDRVLMLESCSHHISCEDIGRYKIPALIKQRTGKDILFDYVPGLDPIPRAINQYAMVIQCGGCMVTGRQLRNRLQPAIRAGVPISNYGMTIAYIQGIFTRAIRPFEI